MDVKSGLTDFPEQTGAKIFNIPVLNTAVSNPPLQTLYFCRYCTEPKEVATDSRMIK